MPKTFEQLLDESGLRRGFVISQLGISRQALDCWCNGFTYPRAGRIMALCDLLRCSPNELMGALEATRQQRKKEVG